MDGEGGWGGVGGRGSVGERLRESVLMGGRVGWGRGGEGGEK